MLYEQASIMINGATKKWLKQMALLANKPMYQFVDDIVEFYKNYSKEEVQNGQKEISGTKEISG